MNASELSRQLLFYGYNEVTDYLKNSTLNRYIYKKFLVLLPENQITVPMVKLFNEIYYQCIHVNFDAMPGVDVESRYISECETWLGSKPAMEVVFSCVYAILNNKQLNFQEECFLSQVTSYIKVCDFHLFADELEKEVHWLGITLPDQFPAMTSPVERVPKFEYVDDRHRSLTDIINSSVETRLGLDPQHFELMEHTEAWMTVTGKYSHSIIEKLVALYVEIDDQLELIERIQTTQPRTVDYDIDGFLWDLKNRIKTGKFNPEEASWGKVVKKDAGKPKEEDDYEAIKKKCKDLETQIEDIKKSHEMEMARREAQYKAEIDKIRKERNALAHEPVSEKTSETDEKPKELTLTLSEMAAFVKERFSKSGADEICTMLYKKSAEHGFLGEDTFKAIDGIVPAVLKRSTPQTNVEITTAHQVNVNPQEVKNYTKDGKN